MNADPDEEYQLPHNQSKQRSRHFRNESDVIGCALAEVNQSADIDQRQSVQFRRESEAVQGALFELRQRHNEMEMLHNSPNPNFKFDPTLMGPLNGRTCTDKLFLLLFIAFFISWIGVAGFAFVKGNMDFFTNPRDSNTNVCEPNQYLFYFDLTRCFNPLVSLTGCTAICVSECSTRFFEIDREKSNEFKNVLDDDLKCIDKNVTKAMVIDRYSDYINFENPKCSRYYFPTQSYEGLGRRCIPDINKTRLSDVLEIAEKYHGSFGLEWKYVNKILGITTKTIKEISDDLPFMICLPILSVILSIALIFLMKYIVKPALGTFVILTITALVTLIYITSEFIFNKRDVIAEWGFNNTIPIQPEQAHTFYTTGFTVSVIVLITVVLVLLFLRQRLLLAVAVIQEGCRAVTTIKSTIFFPFIMWIFQVGAILFTIAVGLHLLSSNESCTILNNFDSFACKCSGPAENYTNGYKCSQTIFDQYCHSVSLDKTSINKCDVASCGHHGMQCIPEIITFFHVINVIGLFWSFYFLSGFETIVLGSTFATWYWTFHKTDLPALPLLKGTKRVLKYHIGTITIGWLLLSVVSFVEIYFKVIEDFIIQIGFKIPIFTFFNTSIILLCAIYGLNYFFSMIDVVLLLFRNFLRYLVLQGMSLFLFTLTTIGIASILTGLVHFYNTDYKFIAFMTSFYISSIFFHVYLTALNTLIFCFLKDCELNDGSFEKPYFMSSTMMKIICVKNAQPRRRYSHYMQ